MRGVLTAYAVFHNGVYRVVIECRDRDSFELLRRKLRLIGVYVEVEKGFS